MNWALFGLYDWALIGLHLGSMRFPKFHAALWLRGGWQHGGTIKHCSKEVDEPKPKPKPTPTPKPTPKPPLKPKPKQDPKLEPTPKLDNELQDGHGFMTRRSVRSLNTQPASFHRYC